jgi:hypothetical protein
MPSVLTIKALRLVNTDYLAALATGPPFLFVLGEMPYAERPDIFQILDHTHDILGSIAFIQMFQPVAGKAVTTKTVLDFGGCQLLTVLNPA